MTDADACPYAPQHKPNWSGRCDWCLADVPEPWYVRSRLRPADLVAQIAAGAGVPVPQHVASRIVEALFGYADTAMQRRQMLRREMWEDERHRERVRASMRRELLHDITSQGRIPVTLPSEAVRYLEMPPGLGGEGREVPRAAVEAGADYAEVQVILAVTCRSPAVDREAAVRAGVL